MRRILIGCHTKMIMTNLNIKIINKLKNGEDTK